MTGVDDLFSPERLRRRWAAPTEGGRQSDDGSADAGGTCPHSVLEKLEALSVLLKSRYPLAGTDAFRYLLERLDKLLREICPDRDPLDGGGPDDETDWARREALELIDRLEDLVEAFDLAKQDGGPGRWL